MSLRPPPKRETPSRVAARMIVLLVLAAGAGLVIYVVTTNQRIGLVEDTDHAALSLDNAVTVDGLTVSFEDDPDGEGAPVILLHDVDATGGLTLRDLAGSLGEGRYGVRVDLPGFGYSSRLPEPGSHHTVAGLTDVVAAALESRFGSPVRVIGVGLGGEVGVELAHSYPSMVEGLVMVDVDFWAQPDLEASLESLPGLGKAAVYTWETGGRFALDRWAPFCEDGGWCPTQKQMSERELIVSIRGTTESIHAFRRTPEAALAPANLTEIEVPLAYVWSGKGVVPAETVQRMRDEIPSLTVIESDSFQAHLEDPGAVIDAIAALGG